MFGHLSNYNHIFVTGPQRSGTRIGAHIIASDTGLSYVDEQEFSISDPDRLAEILKREKIVIQCPAICNVIETYSDENTLIVMMIRDLESIIESQNRIGWKKEKSELLKYGRSDGRIADVKYSYWLTHQRVRISNWLEVYYRDLYTHPLFVPKIARAKFTPDQWESR